LNRFAEIRRRKEARRRRKAQSKPPVPFKFVPTSLLYARGGPWMAQKRRHLSSGMRSELGRDENLLRFSRSSLSTGVFRGTSIFDPVLCEIAYRYCPEGGLVLDPFSGGSVRGLVAGMLGRRYYGVDLSARQIEANIAQRERIAAGADIRWTCGDARDAANLPKESGDLLFTCPPFGDLEVYSNDARDLSCMEWPAFVEAYHDVIRLWAKRLRDDRFAIVVVAEIRGPDGFYRGLLEETVRIFQAADMRFYQDAVLATPLGSAALRMNLIHSGAGKLVPAHQHVRIFVRGDPKKAWAACRAARAE
jgi:hypothetical protein